ncbi:hypothetical protein [Paraburkholderia hospita]|uniref:hypothetical protein n=1 Tax=Paraburkholderia hospita TaxID=169430 RepID=UPI003ECCCDE5
MSDHPFYSDSGFWQFVVAGIAVVLSQCPPVRFWFKRAKLDVECFDRIVLNEEVGLPNVQWHLAITNTGGREIRIQKITLTLVRGQERKELNARGYFEKLSDQQVTLLTPFRLKPGEEWGHAVNFIVIAPREARQAFSAAAKTIKDDITTKRAASNQLEEADPAFVQPLLALFDANFFWRTGEYEVTLNIETDTPKADLHRSFRFTLFESESEQLRSHRDELKFGNGVYFRSPPVDPHFADVHQVV